MKVSNIFFGVVFIGLGVTTLYYLVTAPYVAMLYLLLFAVYSLYATAIWFSIDAIATGFQLLTKRSEKLKISLVKPSFLRRSVFI